MDTKRDHDALEQIWHEKMHRGTCGNNLPLIED